MKKVKKHEKRRRQNRILAVLGAALVLAVLVLVGSTHLIDQRYTVTMSSADPTWRIEPVLGTIEVSGARDTDVTFMDVDDSRKIYTLDSVTPGIAQKVQLERGHRYIVQGRGAGELTIRYAQVHQLVTDQASAR